MRSQKRSRAYTWRLRINTPSTFRTWIEMIKSVPIDTSEITIIRGPEFTGMALERIDDKKTCLVNARMACEVEGDVSDDACMNLSLADVMHCLKGVSAHYILEIEYDGEKATFVSREQTSLMILNKCIVSTHMLPTTPHEYLPEQEYDYIVEISRAELARVIAQAADINASELRMRIFIMENDGQKSIIFCISAEGTTVKMQHYFPSTFDEDRMAFVASFKNIDIDEMEATDCVVNDAFCMPYLRNFLKSMNCEYVKLRMGCSDDCPPPLGVFCQLADNSYVSYALASKLD